METITHIWEARGTHNGRREEIILEIDTFGEIFVIEESTFIENSAISLKLYFISVINVLSNFEATTAKVDQLQVKLLLIRSDRGWETFYVIKSVTKVTITVKFKIFNNENCFKSNLFPPIKVIFCI